MLDAGTGSNRLALTLTLVPLTRLVSLAMPLANVPQLVWYPIVTVPLLIAAWIIIRQLRVSRMRLAPDGLGLLRLERLQRDGVHRGDGGELHETLGLHVADLRGHGRERIEPRHEQSRRPFGTSQFGHGSHLRGCIGRSSLAGPVPGT